MPFDREKPDVPVNMEVFTDPTATKKEKTETACSAFYPITQATDKAIVEGATIKGKLKEMPESPGAKESLEILNNVPSLCRNKP